MKEKKESTNKKEKTRVKLESGSEASPKRKHVRNARHKQSESEVSEPSMVRVRTPWRKVANPAPWARR